MRAADVVVRRKLSSTESFLAFAMKHEGISVVRVREWAYCAHTRKALLDSMASAVALDACDAARGVRR